jgi:hypothetical protein
LASEVTDTVDARDMDTTAQYEGCGHVTRTWTVTDKRGHVHAIKITVSGWKLMVLIDAGTKIPLAGPKVLINEYEVLSMRTVVR